MSNSLRPHELQHIRPPCPSPTPRVYSNSCPSSQWCHLAVSSSVIPFSSCPQSLPASGSFPMSQLFASGGQSIGSFSFNISPSNEHPGLITFNSGQEKKMATHSSTLAWKIPWMGEPGRLQSMGFQRVGHDWATSLSLFTFMHWRRKWQLTPVFSPGESQGRGSLVGCCLWGRTESDTTEAT